MSSPSAAHPLGFLDDVFRAVAAKAQSVGAGRSRSESPAADTFGGADDPRRSRPSGSGSTSGKRRKAGRGPATLIVDTDPARDGWKSAFTVHVTAPPLPGSASRRSRQTSPSPASADRLEARTASGDVRVDEVIGRSVVQTASGDVSIAATADCDMRTASG